MIPLTEAQDHVLARMPTQPVVEVPLGEAFGLVVAVDVASDESVPGYDNTAVDGYAVRSSDVTAPGVELDVVGTIAAGSPVDHPVGAGEAVRVMTGAAIPPGADAVVMVERTARLDDGRRVRIEAGVEPGAAIRRVGEDVTAGDIVAAAGTVLGVGHIGLLASVGVREVAVRRRVVVGVVSTGDELVEGPQALEPGQIRKIVDVQTARLAKHLAEQEIGLELTDAAKDELAKQGYSPEFGARPLKRAIQKNVQNLLADAILGGKVVRGDVAVVDVSKGNFWVSARKAENAEASGPKLGATR